MKINTQEHIKILNTNMLVASIFNTNLTYTGRQIKEMTKNRIKSTIYPPTEFVKEFYKYHFGNHPAKRLSPHKRYYIRFDTKTKKIYVQKATIVK